MVRDVFLAIINHIYDNVCLFFIVIFMVQDVF